MYSITIHEMAHAAHWRMVVDSPDNDNNDYSNSESRLKESWAQGVEWFITGQTYFHYDKFNSSYNNFKIFHNLIDSGYTVDYIFSYRYPGLEHYLWYTNVVIDLVDSYPNEYEYSYLYSEGDTVNGIPIATIEDALLGATTWNEWKSNIKQNYSYEIQQNIETVFGLWSLE